MKHLERSIDKFKARGFMAWSILLVMLNSACLAICSAEEAISRIEIDLLNSAFVFMEKYRNVSSFSKNIEKLRKLPEHEATASLRGQIIKNSDGASVLLKNVLEISKTFNAGESDCLILFGYLWDKDLHMRCLAYSILARKTQMPTVLPPVRILGTVGSVEFQEMSIAIAEKMRSADK